MSGTRPGYLSGSPFLLKIHACIQVEQGLPIIQKLEVRYLHSSRFGSHCAILFLAKLILLLKPYKIFGFLMDKAFT